MMKFVKKKMVEGWSLVGLGLAAPPSFMEKSKFWEDVPAKFTKNKKNQKSKKTKSSKTQICIYLNSVEVNAGLPAQSAHLQR